MNGYIGYENHLENSPFLKYLLSSENITFVKKRAEFFLKDFHPDKKTIQINNEVVKDFLLEFYHKKQYVHRGDIYSRYHHQVEKYKNELKELNQMVVVELVESIKAKILHETRYRGFNPWDANLLTRQTITNLPQRKKIQHNTFEPRY